jgi:probable rRNA maturation factor
MGDKKEQIFIGELILCPAYVKQNVDKGESLEHALAYITAHGILHLLGFEHGKKMFALQAAVADNLVV